MESVAARPRIGDAACPAITCRSCGVYQLCVPLGLDGPEFGLLDSVVKRKQVYKRGETLFNLGAPVAYIYAIRSGSVKTSIATDNGGVQITGFHVPGELLALDAISAGHYTCEARALETTSVCEVAVDRFGELAARMPVLQHELIRIMSGEILQHQELLLLLGKKTAGERLAAYLLSLSQRFAKRGYSPLEFNLSMSRGDIGNYLGIAEETVCRVLSRFDEEGLIAIRRRSVTLRKPEALRKVARGLAV
jgi:CRP/FNR family transcriptional regulator